MQVHYMKLTEVNKIDLGELRKELYEYEGRWIAISPENAIVANGKTYQDTVKGAKKKGMQNIVLFKVPPLAYSLSP